LINIEIKKKSNMDMGSDIPITWYGWEWDKSFILNGYI